VSTVPISRTSYDAAFFRDDITAVLAKHEFSAATMADGYSRSGAGLGVVAATSGGGCLNTVPGLGEALASRVPVLALIGQPPTTLDGLGSFQDTSGRNGALGRAGAVLRGVGVLQADRNAAGHRVRTAEAVAAARTGGPAVLLLPKNIQQGRRSASTAVSAGSSRPGNPSSVIRRRSRTALPPTAPIDRVNHRQRCSSARPDDATASNSSGYVRCCAARVDTARLTPRMWRAYRAWDPSSGAWCSGNHGEPGGRPTPSRKCGVLLLGTRLSVTFARRSGRSPRIGCGVLVGSAAPYVPCTHIHTASGSPSWVPVGSNPRTPPLTPISAC